MRFLGAFGEVGGGMVATYIRKGDHSKALEWYDWALAGKALMSVGSKRDEKRRRKMAMGSFAGSSWPSPEEEEGEGGGEGDVRRRLSGGTGSVTSGAVNRWLLSEHRNCVGETALVNLKLSLIAYVL